VALPVIVRVRQEVSAAYVVQGVVRVEHVPALGVDHRCRARDPVPRGAVGVDRPGRRGARSGVRSRSRGASDSVVSSTYILTPPIFFTMSAKPSKFTISAPWNVMCQFCSIVFCSNCTPPALPTPFWLPSWNAALILSLQPVKCDGLYAGIAARTCRAG